MSVKTKIKMSVVMSMIVLCVFQTALAGIIYVDQSRPSGNGSTWKRAYPDLQDAIADAVASDQIFVAQGTYTPGADRLLTFQLKNGVEILGGYAGYTEPDPDIRDINAYPTILSGDINGNDGPDFSNYDENNYHVVTGSATNSTAILDGFTITGGNANGGYPHSYGGGLYNNAGSPTIRSCTFINNTTSTLGGGMYNFMNSSAPLLTNCIFKSNMSAGSGGAISNSGRPTLINCLLTGNTAGNGGAINSSNLITLINCTIAANSAPTGDGGGIFCLGTLPSLTNCILWANTDIGGTPNEAAQIYVYSGTPAINYTCIQGWTGTYGGTGNIGDDPLFVDIDGPDNIVGNDDDNARLLYGSPCLDTGDNSAVPGYITSDLDGDSRIQNTTVDMGPYEGANQAFILDTKDITVPEGSTAIFTVALAIDPLSTIGVTVAYQSGDTDITVDSGASFSFNSSNYSTPVEVTLAAAEDTDYHHGSTLIWISAAGIPTAGVTATEADNEPVPTILYVDETASGANDGTSWLNAFTELIDASDTASIFSQVQQIYIAEGTYYPAGPGGIRDTAFRIRNDLAVYGGFPAGGSVFASRDPAAYPTILSGDLNGDDGPDFANNSDNSYHVIKGEGLDSTAIVDGLIIKAGNASSTDHSPTSMGGGFYCIGDPQVVNCTFTENFAEFRGGGMRNELGNPNLTDCTFIANAVGDEGGGMSSYGNPILIDCAFTGNSTVNSFSRGGGLYNAGDSSINNCTFSQNTSVSDGGGMYNYELFSLTTLTNCIFTENTADNDGGGLYNHHSDLTLTGCRFISNSAVNGGGAMYNILESTQTLVNCIFNHNQATYGGAISNEYSSGVVTSLINCTLTANMAPNGNAVACEGNPSTFDIANSILWDGGNEIYNINSSTVTVSYSDIHTGPAGSGNISADPIFVDADGPDDIAGNTDDILHLAEGSPCIDAGNNSHPFVPITDILDGPRLIDDPTTVDTGIVTAPIVDMGVYEFAVGGDMDLDGDVDLPDHAVFASLWRDIDCNEDNRWCNRADFNYSGDVTFDDLIMSVTNWLEGATP